MKLFGYTCRYDPRTSRRADPSHFTDFTICCALFGFTHHTFLGPPILVLPSNPSRFYHFYHFWRTYRFCHFGILTNFRPFRLAHFTNFTALPIFPFTNFPILARFPVSNFTILNEFAALAVFPIFTNFAILLQILPFRPNDRLCHFTSPDLRSYRFSILPRLEMSCFTNFPFSRPFRLFRCTISTCLPFYRIICFTYIACFAIVPGGIPLSGRVVMSDCASL